MVAISVGLAIGLVVLGIATMIFAGIRSLALGNQDIKKMAMMAIPFIVFGISFAVVGEYAKAGVLTAVIMMAIMVAAIFVTGLRGTFKF
jgi:uncharacterized membrane protein YfbV (UPF0208 family)